MSDTSRLALPRIDAAQAQKHVTHNEALAALDALVHLSVSQRNVTAPPAAPAAGFRCIVDANASGAFAGRGQAVAAFEDGAWRFFTPQKGWRAFVEQDARLFVFNGQQWLPLAVDIEEAQRLRYAGIGGTADANNPFLAKLNSALFMALRTADGGTGDLRVSFTRRKPRAPPRRSTRAISPPAPKPA